MRAFLFTIVFFNFKKCIWRVSATKRTIRQLTLVSLMIIFLIVNCIGTLKHRSHGVASICVKHKHVKHIVVKLSWLCNLLVNINSRTWSLFCRLHYEVIIVPEGQICFHHTNAFPHMGLMTLSQREGQTTLSLPNSAFLGFGIKPILHHWSSFSGISENINILPRVVFILFLFICVL